ncbi:MAG: ACP S-malonyltransferase [Chloroflexota bacterium]|nr:ACP S-malonyltransferase [Chloroflexota bacterium]
MSFAFVFPGQGAQYVGMGRDLYETYPQARRVFDEADGILGFSLSRLCFEGPAEMLNDTINTQPAILTMTVALLRVLEQKGLWASYPGEKDRFSINGENGSNLPTTPRFVAGHSLGEYCSLAATRSLDFATLLLLARERGRLMRDAGQRHPGGMAAILGLEAEVVDEICLAASLGNRGIVQTANYNAPGQIVISGDQTALETAVALAQARGAGRVIPLEVSIAAHSPLMEYAAERFRHVIESVSLQEPAVPIVANVTATPATEVSTLKNELERQLISSVRWTESVQYMIKQGVTTFIEIGPRNVLQGLIKRTDGCAQTRWVGDVDSVEAAAKMARLN